METENTKNIKLKSQEFKKEFKHIKIAINNANKLTNFIQSLKQNDYFSCYNKLFIYKKRDNKLNLKLLHVNYDINAMQRYILKSN